MNKNFATLVVVAACLVSSLNAAAAPVTPAAKHRTGIHRSSWIRGHCLSPSDRRRAVPIDAARHHLARPPRGFRWMRIGSSVLLVGQTSGLILRVVSAH